MKCFAISAALAAWAPLVSSFPSHLMERYMNDPKIMARTHALIAEKRDQGADAATLVFETIPTFDGNLQYIDVSAGSGHEWQAPGPGDLRGPCPGLNAFANHGFLPRNGFATIAQFIDVTTSVVGMGIDLAAFLAVLGGLIDSGDLLSWSIGGTPTFTVGSLLGATGHGLIGSHNKYENDVSSTRPDLYESGNNYITSAAQFQDLINASPGGFITLNSLSAYRSQRFDRQVANNPYFFNAPFPGILVQPAGFTFPYRFMANHSADAPLGTLDYETMKSWFGITGTNGSFQAPFGYERIPNNWYRRSMTAPYTIPYFLGDVTAQAVLHPKFLSVGGNLNGQPGTFAGVDVANLTGGLFNSADLLKGNNLGCFAFQAATQFESDIILKPLLERLQTIVGSIITQLGCPQLINFNPEPLKQFPGFTKSPSLKPRRIDPIRKNGEV